MVPTLGNAPSESKDKGFTVLPTSLMEYVGIYMVPPSGNDPESKDFQSSA